jgi:hypothetical protein
LENVINEKQDIYYKFFIIELYIIELYIIELYIIGIFYIVKAYIKKMIIYMYIIVTVAILAQETLRSMGILPSKIDVVTVRAQTAPYTDNNGDTRWSAFWEVEVLVTSAYGCGVVAYIAVINTIGDVTEFQDLRHRYVESIPGVNMDELEKVVRRAAYEASTV